MHADKKPDCVLSSKLQLIGVSKFSLAFEFFLRYSETSMKQIFQFGMATVNTAIGVVANNPRPDS